MNIFAIHFHPRNRVCQVDGYRLKALVLLGSWDCLRFSTASYLRIIYVFSTVSTRHPLMALGGQSIGNKACSGIEVVITALTRKRVTTSEPVSRKVLILQGFGGIIQEKNFSCSLHQFSPFSGVLFEADVAKNIRSGIEVVITGLTRNQFGSNPTRVRIPPAAPKKFSLQAVLCRL